jgi:hypothetical protein
VLPVAKEIEQLPVQVHLHVRGLCGPLVNRQWGLATGPVSMCDHALDRAEEENARLKKRVEQLERRLKEVFP